MRQAALLGARSGQAGLRSAPALLIEPDPVRTSGSADPTAKPHGNIHFAGEHTALMTRDMEGAFDSGERAVFDLLART